MHQITFTTRILEVLGSKSSRLSIAASASLAILCLFYVFTVGTQLQIRTYPLIDRITYFTDFNLYIVNEFADHIIIGSLLILWLALSMQSKIIRIMIAAFAAFFVAAAVTNYDPALDGVALAALPAIASLFVYNRFSRRIINSTRSSLTLNYVAITGMIVGLISFTLVVSSIFSGNAEGPVARSYAYDIFLLFSSFSPILMLILITSFPIKMLINFLSNMYKRKTPDAPEHARESSVSVKTKIAYLSLFAFISIIMVVIPHLPTVNNDNQLVGVDTRQYAAWMDQLRGKDAQEFLDTAFVKILGGDRPLSLVLIFIFQGAATNEGNDNATHVIEYVPVILGPSLVLATYFLTRELSHNDITSLLAAFLGSISFQVLIGVYGGFYANWISLLFAYLACFFLLRFLRQRSNRDLALYGILMTLTLFSHVYTWSIFAIIMGIFLAVCMTRWNTFQNNKIQNKNIANKEIKRNAILIFLVLLSTVAIDIGRITLTDASGGIERDLQLGSSLAGLEQFTFRWNNLTYATTVYVGGLFANFIILGLGLYWLFTSKMRERQNIFLIIFLSIGILPFLFGEWVIQTRVFYNIPFQIPAALALFHIIRQANDGLLKSISIYIWLITMSVIAVSNFYLVLPLEAP